MNDVEPISHAYLRSDIRNSIRAIAIASRSGRRGGEYAAGFADALEAVAAALGLESPQVRVVTVDVLPSE